MISYQVVCIAKSSPENSIQCISEIGYYEAIYRPRVMISIHEAIRRIEANRQAFYVATYFGCAFIEVVRPEDGTPYLRSCPDHSQIDNLLTLALLDNVS